MERQRSTLVPVSDMSAHGHKAGMCRNQHANSKPAWPETDLIELTGVLLKVQSTISLTHMPSLWIKTLSLTKVQLSSSEPLGLYLGLLYPLLLSPASERILLTQFRKNPHPLITEQVPHPSPLMSKPLACLSDQFSKNSLSLSSPVCNFLSTDPHCFATQL